MEDPPSILVRFRAPILVSIALLAITGIVLLLNRSQLLSPYKVEVIAIATSEPQVISSPTPVPILTVDVSGEVVTPGLYTLEKGKRIGDALESAGGTTSKADKSWIEKNINKAALLVDGQKVYIPGKDEQIKVLSASKVDGGSPTTPSPNVQVSTTININAASQKELEELWGIGPATAQKIIDQRPYSDVSELLNKKILKKNVYDRIYEQLSVY
jgi:competence protein ComEA